ncbi:hypothetical protein [Streptomyces sp. NPDC057939]|uniref:hypothetical protein n=1 Tax=Streptomyces sp. NPDC057939 TaxID=3346284 RepID=UPI0036F10B1F
MTTRQLSTVWSLSSKDAQAGWRALWWDIGPDGALGVILVQEQNLHRSPYVKGWIGWRVATTCDRLLIVVKDGTEHRTTLRGIKKSTGGLTFLSWSRLLLRDSQESFVVYSPGGYPINHISLGECVEYVVGDRDGGIWTAYGDQGIYGDHPASRAGLARWNTDGDHTWTPQHLPELPLGPLAGTTEGTLAWLAWYSHEGAFLTRVNPTTEEETSWKIPIRDIDGLTVQGNRMILTHSFHNRPGIELHHAELIDNTWVITTQEKLTLPEPMSRSCVKGRDGILWLRSGDTWTRITL